MEFGKWEQTIKSNLRNRTDVTSTEEFKSVYGAAHKRPRLSVIELNENAIITRGNGHCFFTLAGSES